MMYRITFDWRRMPKGRSYRKTYAISAETDREARDIAEQLFLERHPGLVQGLIVEMDSDGESV